MLKFRDYLCCFWQGSQVFLYCLRNKKYILFICKKYIYEFIIVHIYIYDWIHGDTQILPDTTQTMFHKNIQMEHVGTLAGVP